MKIKIWVISWAWISQDGTNEAIYPEVFYTEEDCVNKVNHLWGHPNTNYVIFDSLTVDV